MRPEPSRTGGGTPTLSVQQVAQRMQDGSPGLLVDVREIDEYRALRADGTVLLPLTQLGVRFHELPADRPLMLICRSGARSDRATAFLLQQGFSDVSNVEGGMIAWHAAGLPTRSGPLDPGEGELP